jgi:heterodisulfide reductase subunit B
MCQANLDTRQADISEETGTRYEVPILYVSELLGIALGDPGVKSWLAKHLVSPEKLLQEKGLI